MLGVLFGAWRAKVLKCSIHHSVYLPTDAVVVAGGGSEYTWCRSSAVGSYGRLGMSEFGP